MQHFMMPVVVLSLAAWVWKEGDLLVVIVTSFTNTQYLEQDI
jgi:hypothetical protein